MDICENCAQHPAEVHITRIVNGERTEAHLCRACAESVNGELMESIHLGNILIALLNSQNQQNAHAAPDLGECDKCGFPFSRFEREGMLGCPHCYEHFTQALMPVIKRMQGSLMHTGRRPMNETQRAQAATNEWLEELKSSLRAAVEQEHYEQAALLRDQIKEIEARRDS